MKLPDTESARAALAAFYEANRETRLGDSARSFAIPRATWERLHREIYERQGFTFTKPDESRDNFVFKGVACFPDDSVRTTT